MARHYFEQAAENGHGMAKLNLLHLYFKQRAEQGRAKAKGNFDLRYRTDTGLRQRGFSQRAQHLPEQ
jgi:TPR repeat protein